jgi:hypothetical protein
MDNSRRTPFDSIESTHEYVGLIVEAVEEAKTSITNDLAGARPGTSRQQDALRVIHYKLDQLERHLIDSRRILNDLRTLRRILLRERSSSQASEPEVAVPGSRNPSLEEPVNHEPVRW